MVARMLRHLFPPSVRRRLSDAALARITAAIEAGEVKHTGEVCFAVEAALPWRDAWRGASPRDRAHEVFAQQRVWDTEANNGVLLYLLLADHAIEIVADRAALAALGAPELQQVCDRLGQELRAGRCEQGLLDAIARLNQDLAEAFPLVSPETDENELPNRPAIL